MLIEPDGSSFRAVDKYLFADETEVLSHTAIVDKEGVAVATANSRFADDEIVIDDNCTAAGVPEGLSCVGFRQKLQRCSNVARCVDNNQTVRCALHDVFCFFRLICTSDPSFRGHSLSVRSERSERSERSKRSERLRTSSAALSVGRTILRIFLFCAS